MLMRQGFIVQFDSVADRDYYVSSDSAHTAFTKTLTAVDDVTVFDFES